MHIDTVHGWQLPTAQVPHYRTAKEIKVLRTTIVCTTQIAKLGRFEVIEGRELQNAPGRDWDGMDISLIQMQHSKILSCTTADVPASFTQDEQYDIMRHKNLSLIALSCILTHLEKYLLFETTQIAMLSSVSISNAICWQFATKFINSERTLLKTPLDTQRILVNKP